MNNTTSFPHNLDMQFHAPLKPRSKTMSTIFNSNATSKHNTMFQNNANSNGNNNGNSNNNNNDNLNGTQEKSGFGMMYKLKQMFSSRKGTGANKNNNSNDNNINNNINNDNINNNDYNKSISEFSKKGNTRLRVFPNSSILQQQQQNIASPISQMSNFNMIPSNAMTIEEENGSTIQWQPVYHDTCKIKLPVQDFDTDNNNNNNYNQNVMNSNNYNQNVMNNNNNNNQNVMNNNNTDLFPNHLEEFQNNFSNNFLSSEYLKSKMNNIIKEQNFQENGKDLLNKKCMLSSPFCTNSTKNNSTNNNNNNTNCTNCTSSNNNQEEPYSKFKYYYNYYLVDEYLDSLAQSKDKELDATGLNKEGELYENVNLNVKPILTTKERLESGVPYDPQVVIM